MNTEIQIFNKYDYKKNKKSWIKYIDKIIKSKAYKDNCLKKSYIGIYFDDEKDSYILYRIGVGGDSNTHEFFGCDEMMQYIHEYI